VADPAAPSWAVCIAAGASTSTANAEQPPAEALLAPLRNRGERFA